METTKVYNGLGLAWLFIGGLCLFTKQLSGIVPSFFVAYLYLTGRITDGK